MAQSSTGRDSNTSRSSSTTTQNKQSRQDAAKVRVTRASNFLGVDVMASDNRKVGDIVDYYFNMSGTPHLAYIVVMTGGFLNLGGDARAIPASAVESTGDNCRINLTSEQFWDVPVLPENRNRFLSDAQHRQRLSQLFSQSDEATSRSGSTAASSPSKASDDPNRAGAMTGRASGQREMELVSYSELTNSLAYGRDGQRLGYFVDAWLSLNNERAPYIEITPTFEPFRTSFDRRYAIPTAMLGEKRESFGYSVDITTEQLNEAESVTETQGVKMLEEGVIGDAVLRVTLPEN